MNNIKMNIIPTTKFKTTRIQLSFLSEVNAKQISARAILVNMMKQQTKTYPTKAKMLNHLHERYNMRLSALPSKIGRVQMLSFMVEFIHSDYTLEDNDMFLDAVDVLESIVKEPLLTEKLFKQEKRILLEYFDSIYADKSHYALISTIKQMYQDPINSIDGLGDKETVMQLTLEDVKEAYNSLLSDQIVCSIVGNIDEERANEVMKSRFYDPKDEQQSFVFTIDQPTKHHQHELIERQTIKQTNIVIGLHMPVYFDESDYLITRFLNVILGGHSESMLFKEIREKQNMAYYISSSYDPYRGLMFIQTGIEAKNKDRVVSLIKESLAQLKLGEIKDTVFEQSRSQLKNALIQSQDSQLRITNQATLQSIFNISFSVEERIAKLQQLTKSDIARVAKNLELDLIFVLTGDQNEKH